MISRRPSARTRWSSVVWIVGTLSLLIPSLGGWLASPVDLAIPVTPVDRVNGLYARQWAFVQQARQAIPAGQAFATIARDEDEAMLLFMLSVGVIRNRLPVPSFYWGQPVPQAAGARYVLSYGCLEPPGARLVRRFPEGCVWERTDSSR